MAMKIITLCGSLKFKKEIMIIAEKMALKGNCILTPIYPILENVERTEEQLLNLKKEKEKYLIKNKKQKINMIKEAIPNIQNVINTYNTNMSAKDRNELLTKIIDYIEYIKVKKGKGHEDEFTLKIKIKLC